MAQLQARLGELEAETERGAARRVAALTEEVEQLSEQVQGQAIDLI